MPIAANNPGAGSKEIIARADNSYPYPERYLKPFGEPDDDT